MVSNMVCQICGNSTELFDVVDFNKSCEEARGKFLGLSGYPVYYVRCSHCEHCFAPELATWSIEQFEEKIYNEEYVNVDPDYIAARPRANASNLMDMFPNKNFSLFNTIKHLDYGGGGGLLSRR